MVFNLIKHKAKIINTLCILLGKGNVIRAHSVAYDNNNIFRCSKFTAQNALYTLKRDAVLSGRTIACAVNKHTYHQRQHQYYGQKYFVKLFHFYTPLK